MLHSIAVKDYMATKIITVKTDLDILKAVHLLIENRISGVPVLDELGGLTGMLSEKDCMKVGLNAAYHQDGGGKVGEYMTTTLTTIDQHQSIMDVATVFLNNPFKRLPVVNDDGELVGQISRSDVLRAIDELY